MFSKEEITRIISEPGFWILAFWVFILIKIIDSAIKECSKNEY